MCNAVQIHVPFTQGQFVVGDAEFLQRSTAFMRPADHRLHRIIGRARDGDEAVTGTEKAEQDCCEGVRPRDKLRPHEGTLRTKDTCIDLIQLLTPEVTVCVTRTHIKMHIGDAACPHDIEHLLRVLLGNLVHMCKCAARAFQYICPQCTQLISLHNYLPLPSSTPCSFAHCAATRRR